MKPDLSLIWLHFPTTHGDNGNAAGKLLLRADRLIAAQSMPDGTTQLWLHDERVPFIVNCSIDAVHAEMRAGAELAMRGEEPQFTPKERDAIVQDHLSQHREYLRLHDEPAGHERQGTAAERPPEAV